MAAKAVDVDINCACFPTYFILTFGNFEGESSFDDKLIHHKIHIFSGLVLGWVCCVLIGNSGLESQKMYLLDTLVDGLAEVFSIILDSCYFYRRGFHFQKLQFNWMKLF